MSREILFFQTHPGDSSFTVIHSSFLQTATGKTMDIRGYIDRGKFVVNLGCLHVTHLLQSYFIQ